jgi:hypothetical protein
MMKVPVSSILAFDCLLALSSHDKQSKSFDVSSSMYEDSSLNYGLI